MKLYHADEHLECFQYSTVDSTLEIIPLAKNEDFHIESEFTIIYIVIQGAIQITCKRSLNQRINKYEIALTPLHSPSLIHALENSIILKIKIKVNISFCAHMPFEFFLEEYGNMRNNPDLGLLPPNQRVTDFANTMKEYIEDGLRCSFFYEIKIRELLYLLRAYYDKYEVSNFFSPIFCNDLNFSNKIYENLDRAKTVKELAHIINYSPSGFDKRFKKVFNMSPYVWLQEQKAKKIYQEINTTKKTFSELSYEFGFSSPAHFCNFCKKYFGNTPGQLRKNNRERASSLFKESKKLNVSNEKI